MNSTRHQTPNTANIKISVIIILLLLVHSSCEDFIDVGPPPNQLIKNTVFQDDLTATAALLGVYARMGYAGGPASGSINGISYLTSLSSDELVLVQGSPEMFQFNENSILSTNSIITSIWNSSYEYIYGCNSVLEGMDKPIGLTPTLKKQLEGEAKFLRAFTHLYLVNLFGKIPYVTTTDYEANTKIGRSDIDAVYGFIVKDLIESRDLLSEDYAASNYERSRPNTFAASALLARAYLYMGNDASAEEESTRVIGSSQYSLTELNDVFRNNSAEAIWQIENEPSVMYTNDGNLFSNPETRIYQTLSDNLIESFDIDDLRLQSWILSFENNGTTLYAPYKYKGNSTATSVSERSTPLRLGEQYLIRAEARAKQGKLTGLNSAESDLNAIRYRANLDPVSDLSQDDLVDEIMSERKHELFVEWGIRWFDLKRSDDLDQIMMSIKLNWSTNDQLYPLPYEETLINVNMPQNPGYN